jgi:hypothetical protein
VGSELSDNAKAKIKWRPIGNNTYGKTDNKLEYGFIGNSKKPKYRRFLCKYV